MSRGGRVVLALVLLAATGAVGAATTHANGSPQIVFAANRRPTLDGEIEIATAGGATIDLSRSPALDARPAVSPDGRRVAFLSVRTGHPAFYVVRTDGSHLQRVSPYLGTYEPGDLFFGVTAVDWSPDGRWLAADVFNGTVGGAYVVSASGAGWRRVSTVGQLVVAPPAWSPDDRRVAYLTSTNSGNLVRVVGVDGSPAWSARGRAASWSKQGLLAVQSSDDSVTVYTAAGHRLVSVGATWYAWSPDGRSLATLTQTGTLAIHPARSRKAILSRRGFQLGLQKPSDSTLSWLGATTVVVTDGFHPVAVDVRTGRDGAVPAYGAQDGVLSPDGRVAAVVTTAASTSALKIEDVRTGRTRTVATRAACGLLPPFDVAGVLPGDGAVVYSQACDAPPPDLYAIAATGGAPGQLTHLRAAEPTLSPDGSRVAFVAEPPETCFTCHASIWIAHADGTDPQRVTDPGAAFDSPDDADPSFSPDGSEIAFSRGAGIGATASRLYVVPSTGGTPRALGVAGSSPVWGPSRIAYLDENLDLSTVQSDGSDPRKALSGVDVRAFAWSRDGRLAALVSRGGQASIVISGGTSFTLPGLQTNPDGDGLAFSPDGSELALVAADAEGIGDLYTVPATGGSPLRLTHDLGATGPVAWG